jgi:polysaccharide biosynthesis transport protein
MKMPHLLTGKTSLRPAPPNHRAVALLVFAVSFSVAILLACVLPNQYKSQLQILVRNERINPVVSMNDQTTGMMYLDEISEERVNTETALLTSSTVLREVVRACHLADRIHGKKLTADQRSDVALNDLQHRLSVQPLRKSNIINVSYESRDPDTPALILKTLADLYIKEHVKLYGVPGSSSVFRQLADNYAQKLRAAQLALAQFEETHDIVALPKEKELMLAKLTEAQKLLIDTHTTQREAEKQAASLRASLLSLPASRVVERKDSPNQYSIEHLNTLLVDMRNARAQRAARYQPGDRQLQELDIEIAQTQRALDAAQKAAAQEVTTGPNPSQVAAEQEWIHIRAQAAGSGAGTAALLTQIHAIRARMVELDEDTADYGALEEQVKQMENLSQMYQVKAEETEANDAFDRQRIANVAIAEQPFRSSVPASPPRKLIAVLGFGWSCLFGLGTFFGLKSSDRMITQSEQLQRALPAPLLATLPAGTAPPFYGESLRDLIESIRDVRAGEL